LGILELFFILRREFGTIRYANGTQDEPAHGVTTFRVRSVACTGRSRTRITFESRERQKRERDPCTAGNACLQAETQVLDDRPSKNVCYVFLMLNTSGSLPRLDDHALRQRFAALVANDRQTTAELAAHSGAVDIIRYETAPSLRNGARAELAHSAHLVTRRWS
jgi:hypothetical protein